MKSGWVLYAYVIMSNHYHLAVETPEAGALADTRGGWEPYAQYLPWQGARVELLSRGLRRFAWNFSFFRPRCLNLLIILFVRAAAFSLPLFF